MNACATVLIINVFKGISGLKHQLSRTSSIIVFPSIIQSTRHHVEYSLLQYTYAGTYKIFRGKMCQLVMGPAGSGKVGKGFATLVATAPYWIDMQSTFCSTIVTHCETMRRSVHLVNLDPAADRFTYKPSIGSHQISVARGCRGWYQMGIARHQGFNFTGRRCGRATIWA